MSEPACMVCGQGRAVVFRCYACIMAGRMPADEETPYARVSDDDIAGHLQAAIDEEEESS